MSIEILKNIKKEVSKIASKKLKGITVEIGGDTTGLNDAIQKTIDLTSDVQQELREVNSALKFNPENTELLAQKQELLAKQVENTKNKLNVLKEAQEQVEQTFANGDMAEEAYRAFQRELITTQSTLEHFENQLSVASGEIVDFGEDFEKAKSAIDENKQSISEHAGALAEMGQAAAKAVTAVAGAVTAVATYATKFSDDFTQALNNVQASTGATADETEKLADTIQAVYADNLGEDFEDIATAVTTVRQTFKNLDSDSLTGLTKNALVLRDTFDFDVAESINAVDQLMQNFGITSEEAFNLIAQGVQNGLNENGDLLDTIKEFSGDFSGAGLSAEEMFNVLKKGTENSAYNINMIGDAMNEFGIRTKEGTDDVKIAFETLGLTAIDYSENISDTKQAMDDYSKKIEDLEGKLNDAYYQQSKFTDATDDYTRAKNQQAIDKYIAEINELSDNYNSCGDTLRIFTEKQEQSGVSYDELQQKLASGGNSAKEVFNQVITALSSVEDPVVQNTAGVALFGSMWEDMGAKAILSLKDTRGEISTTKNTLEEINNVKYGDIGNQLETLKRSFEIGVIKPVGDEIAPLVSEVIENIKSRLPDVKQKVTELIEAVKPQLPEIKEMLKTVVSAVKEFGSFIIEHGNAIISILMGIVTSIIAFHVINIVQSAIGIFQTLFLVIKSGGTVMQAFNLICSANPITLIVSAVIGLIATLVLLWNNCEGFRSFIITLWEAIKLMMADIWNWILNQYNDWTTGIESLKIILSGAIQAIRDKIQEFRDTWIVIWDIIKAKAEEFSLKFTEIKDGIVSVFTEKIPSAIVGFKDSWIAVWDGVKQKFEEIWSSFESIAKAPINSIIGLINGLISGINWLINGLNTVSITIPDWVPEIGGNSFGISLPYVNEIPYLAKGGILEQGSAIVGEAGAELLTIASGKAIVQPLTNNTTNSSSIGTTNNYYNSTYEINATISNDYDVTKLAYQLEFNRRQNEMAVGK